MFTMITTINTDNSMQEPDKEPQKPLSKGEFITLLSFVIIAFALILVEVLVNYSPKKLGGIVFLIAWMPLLLIHEAGHAITAHLLNWRVKKTVIGAGKLLWLGQFLGANIEFRAIPLEGFVQIQPKANQQLNQFKHALIYLMGPGVELLIFALIASLIGWAEIFQVDDSLSKIVFQGIAFSALAGAIMNLIPIKIGDNTISDGLGIILCLLASKQDYQNWATETNHDKNQLQS